MVNNRFVISGLIINSLAACSSNIELSQPKGDWIDFDSPIVRAENRENNNINTTQVQQYTATASVYQPLVAKPTANKDRFVTVDGKNIPLYNAVRTIVPAEWSVKLSPDVSANFKGFLSWVGNDQWPHVLRKSLDSVGLTSVIDDQIQEVTVIFAAPAKIAMPPKSINATLASAKKIVNGGALSPPVEPVVTPPFKLSTDKTKLSEIELPAKTAALVKPINKVWKIGKGLTLRKGFEQWSAEENCSGATGKWNVQWNTETDYPIDYPLSFTASDFETATSQLFNLYKKAKTPLFYNGYRDQCLVTVSDRK